MGDKNSNAPNRFLLAILRGHWAGAEPYQKFLYVAACLLLASSMFHLVVLIVMRGPLDGDVSWRKPILFGESFGLTALSVGWVMTYLPKWRVAGWSLAISLGVANLGEVLLVSMQQWRGVPSHFNNSTPLDAGIFLAMGLLIVFTGVAILVVTLLSFFALRAPTSVAWAIRVGMGLLVAGQVFGILMIRLNGHTFGVAGAMKVPHALALHGAQVLPLLAWLLLHTDWNEARRTRTVLLGAAGYTLLVAVSAFQTFSGRAPLDLTLAAAAVFGVALVSVLAAYITATIGVRKSLRTAPGRRAFA